MWNSKNRFDLQIWTFSSPNLKCQPEDEMCPSQIYTTFILAEFWVFRQKLENVAKILGYGIDIKGFDHFS
jgi:hypothetical protein